MLPERIGEAAKEGDLETIRAYFEDDSDGERDMDDVWIVQALRARAAP